MSFSIRCAVKISYRAGLSAFLTCERPPLRISTCRWHSQCIVKAPLMVNRGDVSNANEPNIVSKWNEAEVEAGSHTVPLVFSHPCQNPRCSRSPRKTPHLFFYYYYYFFIFLIFLMQSWAVHALVQGGVVICVYEISCSRICRAAFTALGPHYGRSYNWVLYLVHVCMFACSSWWFFHGNLKALMFTR